MKDPQFKEEQIDLIRSILGEFYYALLYPEDFKKVLGVENETVLKIFNKIDIFRENLEKNKTFFDEWGIYDPDIPLEFHLNFSLEEIQIIKICFEKITNYLDDWDIDTRLGNWSDENESLRLKLKELLSAEKT